MTSRQRAGDVSRTASNAAGTRRGKRARDGPPTDGNRLPEIEDCCEEIEPEHQVTMSVVFDMVMKSKTDLTAGQPGPREALSRNVTPAATPSKEPPTLGGGGARPVVGADGFATGRPHLLPVQPGRGQIVVPRPDHYFHFSYRLLPTEGQVELDAVTFGHVAKFYTSIGSRATKGWTDQCGLHFTFSMSHPVMVTKTLLKQLYEHVVEVRVWNKKDFVSKKAFYDRPKVFGLEEAIRTGSTPRHGAGSAASTSPEVSHSRGSPNAKHPASAAVKGAARRVTGMPPTSMVVPVGKSDKKKKAGFPMPVAVIKIPLTNLFDYHPFHLSYPLKSSAAGVAGVLVEGGRLAHLQSLNICITVSEGNLMSPQHLRELCPMCVTIRNVRSLPKTPLNHEELAERSDGVHVKFQMPGHDVWQTTTRPHAGDIVFEETCILLLGRLDRELLREFLCGPPMVFEVHDRDKKRSLIEGNYGLKRGDFDPANNPDDARFGTMALVEDFMTDHDVSKGRAPLWDPYGQAHVDLSEFAAGTATVKAVTSVVPCPNITEQQRKFYRLNELIWGDANEPMLAGAYSSYCTVLEVAIDVPYAIGFSQPHNLGVGMPLNLGSSACPYGRVIYIHSPPDELVQATIMEEVAMHNSNALDFPRGTMDDALQCATSYKLNPVQRRDNMLDVLTGFEVSDGETCVTVVEGLAASGIQRVLQALPRQKSAEGGSRQILYNSSLTFSKRLYGLFSLRLERFALRKPLEVMLLWDEMYLREKIPMFVIQGLQILNKLFNAKSLSHAVKTEAFIQADDLRKVAQCLGSAAILPRSRKEIEDAGARQERQAQLEKQLSLPPPGKGFQTSREWTPLDYRNMSYEQLMVTKRKVEVRDYVKKNVLATKTNDTRRRPPLNRSKTVASPVHIYSCQMLNRNVEGLRQWRENLTEAEKRKMHTNSKDFLHSGAIPIVDCPDNDLSYHCRQQDKSKWLSSDDFCAFPRKTAVESNAVKVPVHEARKEELHEPWEEHILHANTLLPPVDRSIYTWELRRQDLTVYEKPAKNFGAPDPPHTIFAAGDTLARELRDAYSEEKATWRKAVLPGHDTTRGAGIKTHRTGSQLELATSRPTRPDQLKGLLKDAPRKKGLKITGLPPAALPPLGVVRDPGVDTEANRQDLTLTDRARRTKAGVVPELGARDGFAPGPDTQRSLTLSKNAIPIDTTCGAHAPPRSALSVSDSFADRPCFRTFRQQQDKMAQTGKTRSEDNNHLAKTF